MSARSPTTARFARTPHRYGRPDALLGRVLAAVPVARRGRRRTPHGCTALGGGSSPAERRVGRRRPNPAVYLLAGSISPHRGSGPTAPRPDRRWLAPEPRTQALAFSDYDYSAALILSR